MNFGNRVSFAELIPGFNPHHGNLRKTFFKCRRLQLFGHLLHDFFTDRPVALAVSGQTDLQRHIEKNRLGLIAKAPCHTNPLAAFMNREIGGVHIVPGHAGDQAGTQQGEQGAEDQSLVALLFHIIKKNSAQHIAGERSNAAALEPGGFPGSGQSNGQEHITFGCLL